MDYSRIYIELMERSFERELDCYVEKHHVIPKCMGGDNKSRNIAILTPEEHYVAHLLLVKIYPTNYQLVYAANMMGSTRSGNKLYGWLRRKISEAQKGNKKSPETKQKMSEAQKGKKKSPETKQKMSEAQKGKKGKKRGPYKKRNKLTVIL